MKSSIWAILIVCLICLGCKPDLLDPDRECKKLNASRLDAEYITPAYYFKAPCFNPNNANEFVYLRENTRTNTGDELWKYNLETGEKMKLTSDVWSHTWPRWSVKDWILYAGNKTQLWKVKSNGDSLIQLKYHEGGYRYGDWNGDGTKIVVWIAGGIIGFPTAFTIDGDGFFDSKLDDRISYFFPSWSPDGDKIILTRLDRRSIGRNKIEEAYSIVMMNVDGSGEEVIEL